MKYEITNRRLFNGSNIIDVEFDVKTELSRFPHPPYGFEGTLIITTNDGKSECIYGEHGFAEYMHDYGFIIVAETE